MAARDYLVRESRQKVIQKTKERDVRNLHIGLGSNPTSVRIAG